MINNVKDILALCHQRNARPLKQRKTVATHAMYDKDYPYQYTVYCAYKYPILLSHLEQADISFMPIGRAPRNDHGPGKFGGKRYKRPQGMKDWQMKRWNASWGIQIYTGIPSARNGAMWHDLEFTYQAICAAPNQVLTCIEALINAVTNPLLTLSKSGGLRFSCRVLDYLHSNTEEAKLYIYKETTSSENIYQRDIYLEIVGEMGHSRWDARYEILLGNLLDPPQIGKDVLFAHIDTLRQALHEPRPISEKQQAPLGQVDTVVPQSLGSPNLDLAKDAFLKHGFSYVREDNNIYYWTKSDEIDRTGQVSLWEHDGVVWICVYTLRSGLPKGIMPITELWNDTGIMYSIPNNISAVREGKLSPLAIKRPTPVLNQVKHTLKDYREGENKSIQIQRVLDRDVRILGVIGEMESSGNSEIASYVENGGVIILNCPKRGEAAAAQQNLQKVNLQSLARWRPRTFRWNRIRNIPIAERMANPFQQGNVCEDPEICNALSQKGIDPNDVYCPKCPVYTDCQERGYLAQFDKLQSSQVKLTSIPQLYVNPKYTKFTDEILKGVDENVLIWLMDNMQVYDLFFKCALSRKVIEEWRVNWEGNVLGNFARALLNVLEISDKPHSDAIKRVRATVQGFELLEDEIVRQMSLINVRCRVIPGGVDDPDTRKALARFTIQFECGSFAYIPIDNNCGNQLEKLRLPAFSPPCFVPNEDMKIPMRMSEAIELGILDTKSVQSVQQFPTVNENLNWTVWHQLKFFFAHYKQDTNAPMQWDDEVLQFWMPPVLHPSVKRLLLVSPTISEQNLHRVFPDQKIEIVKKKPASWLTGNKVFQIRSGDYSLEKIMNFDNSWDAFGLSTTAWHIFTGIRAEIERNSKVKHAIISFKPIINRLKNITEKENVCFFTHFKGTDWQKYGFEEAQVIWIVGTPYPFPSTIWRQAQILYGNDNEPPLYERETETNRYKDARVQWVYEQRTVHLLTQIIGRVGLERCSDKTIMLISSLMLPDITDRPETVLFDWEDFKIAGELDKLPETIAIRQHFEAERSKLTADSSKEEVQRVLGCSVRQAYRVLERLRGGPLNVPFREQILSLLSNGAKKTAELVAAIDGHPTSVKNELKRLVDANEIAKVQRGVYALPEEKS